MRFIDKIIYLYLFICISLLLFNFLYILFSDRAKKDEVRRVGQWERELSAVTKGLWQQEKVPAQHLLMMKRRLPKVHELTAYQKALASEKISFTTEERAAYFWECRPVFLELAWKYQKRDPMERAFFAHVVSDCFACSEKVHDRMSEVMLSYLENSTVYCRENVLHALYALGDAHAVGQAFDYISKNGWYHHPRLISDGMRNFSGDKEELIRYLWKRKNSMEEFLLVGIVQFATGVSGAFAADFFQAMQDHREYLEVRLAILRYFHRYPSQEVYPFLLRCLETGEEGIEFSIVAAFVLRAYPQEKTKRVLKQALCSRNWYVRKNAASSLKQLGITSKDREEITAYGDSYANEILLYIEERESV